MAQVDAAEPRRTQLPAPTDRIAMAAMRVSPFCLGLVGEPNTVCEAFDAGINFFFLTADMHWPYYEPLRKGIAKLIARRRSMRDDIVVGVVSYVAQREFTRLPFQEALDSVRGLKHLDLAIIGGAYAPDFRSRLPIYEQHRAQRYLGIRAVGASFHERSEALRAQRENLVDIGFIRCNPAHPGAFRDVLPNLAAESRMRLYNFKSVYGLLGRSHFAKLGLESGYWRPQAPDHYRFVLSRPQFDGVLCAFEKSRQVTALVDAMAEGPLSSDEEQHMINLAEVAGVP